MKRRLLIDGDIYCYQQALAAQTIFNFGDGDEDVTVVNEEAAIANLDAAFHSLLKTLSAEDVIVCITHPENFRKKLLSSYKENRAAKEKPKLLDALRKHVMDNWKGFCKPGIEADDSLGILSTRGSEVYQLIIVSGDKDLETIPGWLYNPRKDTKPRKITEEEADYKFFSQALTGDATDGYKGCPGIGKVKAAVILDPYLGSPLIDLWNLIVETYEAKGLTEQDALTQARMARILRVIDYDFKNDEVILWTPPI